jgi:acetylglutamate kinase
MVQMVLAGKVNKDIVSLILESGGNAVGLADRCNMLKARKLQETNG